MNTFLLILLTLAALAVATSPWLRASLKDSLGLGLERMAYAMGALAYFDDPDFEKKVLGGVEKITADQEATTKKLTEVEKQNKELTDNFGNLQKETKQAFEDLTKCKDTANDHAKTLIAIKRVQTEMRNERRMGWGDPRQRLLGSEENRLRMNAEIRRLCDPKSEGMFKSFMDRAEVKSLDLESTPGSTLITTGLAREIYDLLESYGAWSSLGVRSVGNKTTKYPIQTARPTAKFVRKLANRKLVADTDKEGTSADAVVEMIGVLLLAELELLEDAEVDVAGNILDDLVEAVNYRMDFCAFVADGTDDALHGEYEGIFEGGTASTATAGRTSVDALKYQDYLNTTLAVDAAALQRQPRWWMHMQQLVRSIGVTDANGRPIFQTALEAPSAGAVGTILGYPVTPVAVAPNEDGAGKKIAAFGDPQSYIVAVRKSIELAQSDEYAFDEVSRAYRGIARAGFGFRKASGIAVLTTPAS